MLTSVSSRSMGACALALLFGCFADAGDDGGGEGSASGGSTGGATDSESDATSASASGTSSSGTTDPSGGSSGSATTDPTGADECDPDQVCVGMPPPEWSGPVVLYEGPSRDPAPPCPALYPSLAQEGFSGLNADPAECGACQCADPTGIECAGPLMRLFYSGECGLGMDDQVQLLGHDQCLSLNTSVGGSINSDPIVPSPGTGSCQASGGAANVAEPSWATTVRACGGASSAAECGDGGMCLPGVGDPFAAGLCIWREGDSGCPGGSYTQKHLLFDAVEDDRDCSACTCNAPAGATCDGIIQVHRNSNCSNLQDTLNSPGSECVDIRDSNQTNDPPLSAKMTVFGTTGGQCVPGGGKPEGAATPANPITFCCQN